ncbi:MAG: hypothetical protein JNK58_13605 [Phycisphaerae bacterium]|nr:hypothetical protein [Phycisphaerae bacterium]
MIRPPSKNVTVERAAGVDGAALASLCASEPWVGRSEKFKQDERSSVLSGETFVGPVVVKSMRLDRPLDSLRRRLGITRLTRQWKGAAFLDRHGFAVAPPLALWHGRDALGRPIQSLAMARLPGQTVLQHLADRDLPPEDESAAARIIGEDIARLALLGYVNRDHKPSNLLLLRNAVAGAAPRIAILDTVGLRRCGKWSALVRMLFELVVEPTGCRVEIPLRLSLTTLHAVVRAAELRPTDGARLRRAVRDRLAAHGDPTPRINPLPGSGRE